MLRNPISFIFKLGKYESLPVQPLRQLSTIPDSPSSLLPCSLMTPKVPMVIVQPLHSNQMSS